MPLGATGLLVDEPLGQEERALQPLELDASAAGARRGCWAEEPGLKQGFHLPHDATTQGSCGIIDHTELKPSFQAD